MMATNTRLFILGQDYLFEHLNDYDYFDSLELINRYGVNIPDLRTKLLNEPRVMVYLSGLDQMMGLTHQIKAYDQATLTISTDTGQVLTLVNSPQNSLANFYWLNDDTEQELRLTLTTNDYLTLEYNYMYTDPHLMLHGFWQIDMLTTTILFSEIQDSTT